MDIVEFSEPDQIYQIDIVECMPRLPIPFYDDNDALAGFAWIYDSHEAILNPEGPINSFERVNVLEERVRAFIYSLMAVRNIFTKKVKKIDGIQSKCFGSLTVQTDDFINYERSGGKSVLTHPLAPNIISYITEIETVFKSIFRNTRQEYPYYKSIDSVFFDDKQHHRDVYSMFAATASDETAVQVYSQTTKLIANFVGGWSCKLCDDPDGNIVDEIESEFDRASFQ